MIVLEQTRREPEIHTASESGLVVEPSDISFQDLAGGCVQIRVRIRNDGPSRSGPAFIRLESAPLGAFVPWRPLARLHVPAIDAGESLELNCEVLRPQPAVLGSFDRVPPSAVLTAVNASPDDSAPQPGAGLAALTNLFRRPATAQPRNRRAQGSETMLAPDLWDLLGREQPHWAGNINVFIGSKAVERHLANALRIYPGRTNMAMFLVGGPEKPDAYAFELTGLAPEWRAALYDFSKAKALVVGTGDAPIQETQWVSGAGAMMILLAVRPPIGCRQGRVAVHVRRHSDDQTAMVEFNLDPAAQGAGCYVA
jgi:hypothetical protein